ALERDVVVAGDRGDVRGRVVVIPPDHAHAAWCDGPLIGALYDPERAPAVASFTRSRGGPFALGGAAAARLVELVHGARASLDRNDTLDGLGAELARAVAQQPRPIDARVAHAVEAIRAGAPIAARISRAHLAALFARDVGIPIRRYALWRKLLAAIAAMMQTDATRAAHDAGFADLAHFSRTCRALLGYTPTALRDGAPLTAAAADARTRRSDPRG
ncbi:MAG TPA: helix-turn-helix domain-containing protein, partial [Kofleriaceae bacterium]|nr:helix-turn-helix domain-containing protein [Kofleriaceae bacterium]